MAPKRRLHWKRSIELGKWRRRLLRRGRKKRIAPREGATTEKMAPGTEPVTCMNCEQPLTGPFCSHCGQRHRPGPLHFKSTFGQWAGDLVSVDSRMWRTAVALLFKPGKITADYLRGKRVHFTPPLRLYIGSSLLFFVLGGLFDSREPVEPDVASTVKAQGSPAPSTTDQDEDRPFTTDEFVKTCDEILDDGNVSGWISSATQKEKVKQQCRRIAVDKGQAFRKALISRLPTSLLILLPFLALLMKLLYLFSKRYFLEHLVFFLHLHAFYYIAFFAVEALLFLGGLSSYLDIPVALLVAGLIVYMIIYLFIALRTVFGQDRWLTLVKGTVLVLTYPVGATALIIVLLFYSLMTY